MNQYSTSLQIIHKQFKKNVSQETTLVAAVCDAMPKSHDTLCKTQLTSKDLAYTSLLKQESARIVPIGEIVISIPVITLSVKPACGIRAVRGMIGLLKVVFRRVFQNETRLGAISMAEPLIKRVPACCVSK